MVHTYHPSIISPTVHLPVAYPDQAAQRVELIPGTPWSQTITKFTYYWQFRDANSPGCIILDWREAGHPEVLALFLWTCKLHTHRHLNQSWRFDESVLPHSQTAGVQWLIHTLSRFFSWLFSLFAPLSFEPLSSLDSFISQYMARRWICDSKCKTLQAALLLTASLTLCISSLWGAAMASCSHRQKFTLDRWIGMCRWYVCV